MINLFPKKNRPYFIYAPGYTHMSSGVQTLHLLCHALNESGQRAYILPENPNGFATNPSLNTPLLDPQFQNFYQQNDCSPIAIYPDTVRGNPFNTKHVVRMLLAPRGAYGGDSVFPDSDQIWGALPSIADNVIRVPVTDTNIFYDNNSRRNGSCFYAHKYDRIHGNQLLSITDGFTRLEGRPEKLAEILRNSKACYLYELTSVITEAALCGCPVVLIRSEYFNTIDPSCMMGNVKWSDGEIVKECDNYLPEYQNFIANFQNQLENFIKKTQEIV